jgi:predicted AlkP superfamily pyrophosphatase or phosphodiesterase
VDQLLGWLDAPVAERPRLLTLYFEMVDTTGHHYGPDAPETVSATAEIDAAIARLVDGLKARGLAANLVIVADHGMANVSEERVMDMAKLVPADVARVLWDGTTAGIYPQAGREAEAERALLGRKEHGECWRKGETPARFGYGANPRVPPIVCLADLGWNYRNKPLPPDAAPYRGAHGFDPDAPEMAAVFIGNGPAFRPGSRLAKFPNVSVYPLLAQLAGVTPEANDGRIEDVAAGLR